MGAIHLEEKQFFVGRFSVTDHKCALNITGYVEVGKRYIDPLFFLSLDANANNDFISIKLNSIEMRALATAINTVAENGGVYTKDGGGKGTKNKLTLSSNNGLNTLGLTKAALNPLQITFKAYELQGLSEEINQLVKEVMSSTYKTQQHIERKKEKLKEG